MGSTRSDKVLSFIQTFFPWGQPGFPPQPPGEAGNLPYASVVSWLEQSTRPHKHAALTLLARVDPVLREVEQQLPEAEAPRWLCRVDQTALVKSPESVLDKMTREWVPGSDSPPALTFENFRTEMRDLGRFRIVVNFLSDIERVCSALQEPYEKRNLSGLSPARQALRAEFSLRRNRLEDLVDLPPERRDKGERCRKGVFYPVGRSDLNVEVQVQTMLEEAWDKKDHFLIYEPRRRGERVDPAHNREIFAMSELLYVADLTFDRLREAVVHGRRSKTERAPNALA